MKIKCKMLLAVSVAVSLLPNSLAFSAGDKYIGHWAKEYADFCYGKGIINGNENGDWMLDNYLSREQMVKMIFEALQIECSDEYVSFFDDIEENRWSYKYIANYARIIGKNSGNFKPTENVKREEFLAMTVKAANLGDENKGGVIKSFNNEFDDWSYIDDYYYGFIVTGYDKGLITGSDGYIKPKDCLTRGQACALLYRVINELNPVKSNKTDNESKNDNSNKQESNNGEGTEQEYVFKTNTPILGEAEISVDVAIKWAKSRNAADRFIEVAPIYWKYGKITGIRPEVLYAQAAKETGYGKYSGQVKPEQNNWAGIKKYGATGDAPEDHEDFATPDDGVRGHFNHMSAYVGVEPVGEPHGRYKSVKAFAWSGTITTVEQLGGKWCPTITYGESIVNDYLMPMMNTK